MYNLKLILLFPCRMTLPQSRTPHWGSISAISMPQQTYEGFVPVHCHKPAIISSGTFFFVAYAAADNYVNIVPPADRKRGNVSIWSVYLTSEHPTAPWTCGTDAKKLQQISKGQEVRGCALFSEVRPRQIRYNRGTVKAVAARQAPLLIKAKH